MRKRTPTASKIAFAIAAGVGFTRAQQAAERAERAAAVEKEVSGFTADLFRSSNPWRSKDADVSALTLLENGAARVDRELSDAPKRAMPSVI